MKTILIAGAVTTALLAGVPALAQSSTGGTGSGLRANAPSIVGLGSTEWGSWGYGGPYGTPPYGYGLAPAYSGRSVVVVPAWGPRGYLPY